MSAGIVTTVSSVFIGPLTDYFGPRPMLIAALSLYTFVMGSLWVVGPENKFEVLILTNQGYKIMGTLFKGDAAAFAAQRFHGSLATAVAFVCSQYMLSSDGIPNLNFWAPVLVGMLSLGTFGAFVVTGDEKFAVATRVVGSPSERDE
ncbi:hypothetical protein HDU99_002300 [Rhizoclosmatium hyalinum]|nr:hypothetical protein HDU99_002300 [Rhizoclosmatium hyalinum]